jgi:predicted chitinase
MNFPISAAEISAILGPYGPLSNVEANWPRIEAALDRAEIYSIPTAIAAIATVAVETGNFWPMKERGGPAYLTSLYEMRADLGNNQPGDGARFRGRGFVQITGRWNYFHYSQETGHDLVGNPDLAMDPAVAADILALFFKERGIPATANAGNWQLVRRKVNGGLNNWDRFFDAVTKLKTAQETLTT